MNYCMVKHRKVTLLQHYTTHFTFFPNQPRRKEKNLPLISESIPHIKIWEAMEEAESSIHWEILKIENVFDFFPFCFHHSFPADQQHTEGLVCWGILIWTCVKSEFELREIEKNIMAHATHIQKLQCQGRKEGKIKYNFTLVAYGPQFLCFSINSSESSVLWDHRDL